MIRSYMVIPLKVFYYIQAMFIDASDEHSFKTSVILNIGGMKNVIGNKPICCPDSDIHGTYPVHTKSRWIGRDKIKNLITKFAGI